MLQSLIDMIGKKKKTASSSKFSANSNLNTFLSHEEFTGHRGGWVESETKAGTHFMFLRIN